jgi:hypothetical protein
MGELSAMNQRTNTSDERTRRGNLRLGLLLLAIALAFFAGVFVSRLL